MHPMHVVSHTHTIYAFDRVGPMCESDEGEQMGYTSGYTLELWDMTIYQLGSRLHPYCRTRKPGDVERYRSYVVYINTRGEYWALYVEQRA